MEEHLAKNVSLLGIWALTSLIVMIHALADIVASPTLTVLLLVLQIVIYVQLKVSVLNAILDFILK